MVRFLNVMVGKTLSMITPFTFADVTADALQRYAISSCDNNLKKIDFLSAITLLTPGHQFRELFNLTSYKDMILT